MRLFKNTYLILLVVVLGMASCYKDIGNYDYTEINELAFSGIEDSYTVLLGEHFTLKPEITFSKDQSDDTSNYEYEWIGIRTDNVLPADQRRVISVYRNIDQVITLNPGPYRVYYRVKDKNTGVQWQTIFNMTVISSIYEGWMILNEVNGKSRVDMMSLLDGEYTPIIDVLGTTGSNLPESALGKPLFINCYPFDPTFYGVYICTETGTNKIHPETFKWDFTYDIKYEFLGNLPPNFSIDFMTNFSGNVAWLHGTDNNVYYYYRIFQVKPDVPINILKGEQTTFKASKYIAAINNMAILYDETNKRFVRHINNESTSTLMPQGTLFDYNTGKDLKYMAHSPFGNGNVFAILDSVETQQRFLARFTIGSTLNQVYYEEMIGTDIKQAENFAVSPDLGYIFYNVGGKVYEYDMVLKTSKLMLDFGSQKISMLKFHRFTSSSKYAAFANQLIVGSYDPAKPEGSNGKLQFYNVPPVNGDIVLDREFTNLGKVVSLAYRER